jgi:aspartyl-tRNA(Asn)/glutamyl-tRNA(Gln) amidotransferase subunit B
MQTMVDVGYEVVIGLEVHAQLLTASKMFCSCSTDYADAAPNTHVCPICMGMPGVLPAINRRAVEYTIMTALALNCTILEFSKFDRKNYHYPDLMKGYQISQYDIPLSRNGYLTVRLESGEEKRIGIHRVHLEEDTARLLHRDSGDGKRYSLLDINRAGVPLMEIVSEPDIRSPEEARLYMQKLRAILVALGVSSGALAEGSMRCDANVSLRPQGETRLGTKTEVKNMNSFRAVQRALEYEVARQRAILQAGGRIMQETRGWVEGKGITVSQRSKEYADDYRYFPEPDLPPLVISRAYVEQIRARMPELPDARRTRFIAQYGLSALDATELVNEPSLADYFERTIALSQVPDRQARAKAVSNWMLSELNRLLNLHHVAIAECRVPPESLNELLNLIDSGRISGKQGKDVLEAAFASGERPSVIVEREGIAQLSDQTELERIVEEVISSNAKAVGDYQRGKLAAKQALVGQVMKRTRGRASPEVVNALLEAQLS